MFTLVHITFLCATSTSWMPGVFGESQRSSVFYQREAASRKRHRVICTEEGEYIYFFFFTQGVEVWGNHQEFHMQPFFLHQCLSGAQKVNGTLCTSLSEPKPCRKENQFLFKKVPWSIPKTKKMIHFASPLGSVLCFCDGQTVSNCVIHLALANIYLQSF